MVALVVSFEGTTELNTDYHIVIEIPLHTPPQKEDFRKIVIKHFKLSESIRFAQAKKFYHLEINQLTDEERCSFVKDILALPQTLILDYQRI